MLWDMLSSFIDSLLLVLGFPCLEDAPAGPAGAFAEYAVALADTVAKRDRLQICSPGVHFLHASSRGRHK